MILKNQSEIENKTLPSTEIWRDWFLIIQGIFYFAQGCAFVAIILIPVFLQNELGVSALDSIKAQSIIMIPWYIKIVFGVLSDNVPIKNLGRRKPYILFAGLIGIFGWFLFPSFTEYNSYVILCGFFIALCVAVADTVLDSLGVDITPPHRRGHMQGVGWGFRGLGGAITGVLFGRIVETNGYNIAYYVIGGIMVVGCFSALLLKEHPITPDNFQTIKVSLTDFKHEFKKTDTGLITLFNIFAGAGIAIVLVLSTYMNDELGISIEGLGLGVTFFAVGQFIGALTLGILGQKMNLKPVFLVNTFLYILLILSLLVIPLETGRLTVVYFVIFLVGSINGGYEANQMRINMEFSVGKISGTMYSWFNSISNVAQTALGALIIAAIAAATGSFVIGIQIASVFLFLGLIPGIVAIKKINEK